MAVLNFPTNPTENQIYSVGDGRDWIYIGGVWQLKTTVFGIAPISLVLDRYDLAFQTTTGAGNLNVAQVFKIDNSTSSVKTVSFTNAPATRAMTVVLEITGSVGTVNLPAGVVYAQNVDSTLSTVKTMFIMFWNGTEMKVTTNIKF